MDTYSWYAALNKPWFAPPAYVFGIVWSILYPIIFISFGYVFYQVYKKKIPRQVATPFIINLAANFAFSPIQFGLQNNLLAVVDITIVILTLIWAMKTVWKYSRLVVYAQIPYLAWGLFATLLQYSITLIN